MANEEVINALLDRQQKCIKALEIYIFIIKNEDEIRRLLKEISETGYLVEQLLKNENAKLEDYVNEKQN